MDSNRRKAQQNNHTAVSDGSLRHDRCRRVRAPRKKPRASHLLLADRRGDPVGKDVCRNRLTNRVRRPARKHSVGVGPRDSPWFDAPGPPGSVQMKKEAIPPDVLRNSGRPYRAVETPRQPGNRRPRTVLGSTAPSGWSSQVALATGVYRATGSPRGERTRMQRSRKSRGAAAVGRPYGCRRG